MSIITVTATEMQNNFGRFVPKDKEISYLTDSFKGILKKDYDLDDVKTSELGKKYGLSNVINSSRS